jgi:hypothetical protein
LQSFIIRKKCHSTWDEAGLSATAIATNALVKDFYVIIAGSNVNKVAPHGNQLC